MTNSPASDSQNQAYPRVLPVGEAAFTVEFGDRVDADLNRSVHALDAALTSLAPPGLVECIPSYRSLLVIFDIWTTDPDALKTTLLELAAAHPGAAQREIGRLLEIPVRYGGEDGPDLTDVASHCGLSPAEVITRHSAVTYQVAMLGFAPGFAYLLGLPRELATPRVATPRLRVPPGSVGIAGSQTGIYALATPGGWRIIGRTHLTLFDAGLSEPFLLHAGDRIRFVAC